MISKFIDVVFASQWALWLMYGFSLVNSSFSMALYLCADVQHKIGIQKDGFLISSRKDMIIVVGKWGTPLTNFCIS